MFYVTDCSVLYKISVGKTQHFANGATKPWVSDRVTQIKKTCFTVYKYWERLAYIDLRYKLAHKN